MNKILPLKKGDTILSRSGKHFLVYEDASVDQFKVWVNSPGEAPFEIWRSEIQRKADLVLGKPRWSEKDHENAKRPCPTCGTPACNHPDRIRGEDALPIPPEALKAGRVMIQNFLPHYDWKICEGIAEGIFREMLEKCSK